MRTTRAAMMVGALLLMTPGVQAQNASSSNGTNAQPDVPKTPAVESIPDIRQVNFIDFGARGTSFADNSDSARFQRYRDLRDGGTLDTLRYFKDTEQFSFRAQADHVGYRDQRYFATYNGFGRVKASFEWNQIP